MKLTVTTGILSLALSLASSAFAQSFNKAKMDSLFTAIEGNNKGMGSIAISKNGKLLYTKAIGYSYISGDKKTHADYATKYRIGSISKMFTTVMVFQLIEEKKLALTATLDKYFPKVPNAKKITIANLLNHHSGIHNFTDDAAYLTWNEKPHTQAEMLAIIIKGGSDFAPGTKGQYSNSNFVLLGYIIEKLTGQPYKEALEKRITSKIGLANTYYGGKTNPDKHEAFSYSRTASWEQEPETDMSIPGGAGAILSTPTDLALFIDALFTGKLLNQSSLSQMKTIKDSYGMGLFQIPFGTKKAYGHSGGIDGFSSNLGYFPEDSVAFAYCNNGQVLSTNDIMIGALSIYFNQSYQIPTFKTVAVDAADLNKLVGMYGTGQIPLKLEITTKDGILYCQGTGQPKLTLDATDNKTFTVQSVGATLEFAPEKNELVLKQGGANITFKRE